VCVYTGMRSRDGVVGIATRYGLDGPGIESRWGRDFPHLSRPASDAHPASYTMGTGSFAGVKRPGRDADHPPPSSVEIERRASLSLRGPFLGELCFWLYLIVFGILTRLQAGPSGVRILPGARHISSLQIVHTSSGGSPILFDDIRVLSRG
jgi:hypothetical protein